MGMSPGMVWCPYWLYWYSAQCLLVPVSCGVDVKVPRRILNLRICSYLQKVLVQLLRSMAGVEHETIGLDQNNVQYDSWSAPRKLDKRYVKFSATWRRPKWWRRMNSRKNRSCAFRGLRNGQNSLDTHNGFAHWISSTCVTHLFHPLGLLRPIFYPSKHSQVQSPVP